MGELYALRFNILQVFYKNNLMDRGELRAIRNLGMLFNS